MGLKQVGLLCLLTACATAITQTANYPLITHMKSGEHKLTLSTITSDTTADEPLIKGQSYTQSQQSDLEITGTPKVAIGIMNFDTETTADTIGFSVTVSNITSTGF